MLPEKARYYVMQGLAGTPYVIDRLLGEAGPADFNRRPDPDRFTIREVMGHLADWEGVWLERILKMHDEDHPFLPGYDEGQWAIDHDYSHMDVSEQQARFRRGREKLVSTLKALTPEQWERTASHGEWGHVTIEGLAALVIGHDGYHMRQIADWLSSSAS